MAKEKKYTAKTLEKAVIAYFASISRHVTIREKYETGDKDECGAGYPQRRRRSDP